MRRVLSSDLATNGLVSLYSSRFTELLNYICPNIAQNNKQHNFFSFITALKSIDYNTEQKIIEKKCQKSLEI
jgi:hypothetical protein